MVFLLPREMSCLLSHGVVVRAPVNDQVKQPGRKVGAFPRIGRQSRDNHRCGFRTRAATQVESLTRSLPLPVLYQSLLPMQNISRG